MAGSTTKKAAAKSPAPVEETEEAKRQRLLREAYTAANRRVREAHTEEFFDYYEEEARDRKVDYKRPETPEAKADRQLRELVKANPSLASAYGFTINDDGEPVRLTDDRPATESVPGPEEPEQG